MNILLPQPFIQAQLMMDHENMEYDNNNMTFTSLDENNSTQSQNYIQLNQNNSNSSNNYFSAPFNAKKMMGKNINNKDKFANLKPCSLIYSYNSQQAYDFFYVFNIIPINLNYLSGKKNFSFLSDLNRGVDVCEMSFDTQTVHILYQDIAILPQTFDLLNNLNLSDEKYIPFAKKLQQTAQLTMNINNQCTYSESNQQTFNERSKKIVNSYFGSKKEKRMFALSSSYNPQTSRQSFSVHFSSEMIHTLGYETDSFMLKCSITGFNEFIMRNDFVANMDSLIEGFATQILTSSQQDPIKIKQKFCKNQEEAMEAVFAVYMMKDASLQSNCEQIIIFEILHILDFQVSTKGKKYLQKKRQFDVHESCFLERYLKTLNQQMNAQGDAFDETSGESGMDGNSSSKKVKKGIQKSAKSNEKGQQKRKSRKAKDFISY